MLLHRLIAIKVSKCSRPLFLPCPPPGRTPQWKPYDLVTDWHWHEGCRTERPETLKPAWETCCQWPHCHSILCEHSEHPEGPGGTLKPPTMSPSLCWTNSLTQSRLWKRGTVRNTSDHLGTPATSLPCNLKGHVDPTGLSL